LQRTDMADPGLSPRRAQYRPPLAL